MTSGRLTVAVGLVLALAGCADEAGPIDGASPAEQVEAPEFSGPWASEFTRLFSASSTTDAQRKALADGEVDDAEYTALRAAFVRCLADRGVVAELDADGGFSTTASERLDDDEVAEDAVPACEASTVGTVAWLYEQVRRNPERKDEDSLMVSCLREEGVVGPSYTIGQYRNDRESQTGPDWESDAVRRCGRDPLGLIEPR